MSDLGYSEEYTESQTRLEETFAGKETESQTVAGSSSQDTGSLLTEENGISAAEMLEQSAIENNSTEPIEENGRYDFDGSDYVALSTSGFGYKLVGIPDQD